MVELLVVIAIIGMLIALLLPAVQSAREAARRSQCSNNLKQLGLAFHNHHDAKKYFPSGYTSNSSDPTGRNSDTMDAPPGWAWGTQLLPFMEENSLYNSLQLDLPCYAPQNAAQVQATIATFLCPSASGDTGAFDILDGSRNAVARFGRSNYVANVGQEEPWGESLLNWSSLADGPIYRNSKTRFADITDGTGKTVFLGEHHQVLSSKTWVGVVPGAIVYPSQMFVDRVGSEPDFAATLVMVHSGPAAGELDVIHPPNAPTCHVCQMYAEHPGGCNVLLGDGSVRFISEMINQDTWAALSSRAKGDIVGEY